MTSTTEGSSDSRFGTLPDGTPRFVSAAFGDLDEALDATRDLEERGYARARISVFMAAEEREHYLARPRYGELEEKAVVVQNVELEKQGKALEGAGAGATIGGVLGAAGAGIAAVGTTLVVPPLGIAVAGPLAAALAGAGAGATAGGLVGALVGSGLSEYRARRFEKLVKEGRVIVGVVAETVAERTNVVEVLEAHGGELVRAAE